MSAQIAASSKQKIIIQIVYLRNLAKANKANQEASIYSKIGLLVNKYEICSNFGVYLQELITLKIKKAKGSFFKTIQQKLAYCLKLENLLVQFKVRKNRPNCKIESSQMEIAKDTQEVFSFSYNPLTKRICDQTSLIEQIDNEMLVISGGDGVKQSYITLFTKQKLNRYQMLQKRFKHGMASKNGQVVMISGLSLKDDKQHFKGQEDINRNCEIFDLKSKQNIQIKQISTGVLFSSVC